MLRDRRKQKKLTSKTPYPSIFECETSQFVEFFDKSIPKFRLRQTEDLIAKLNKLCLETNTAGPKALTESSSTLEQQKVNGSDVHRPTLYPALVRLARQRSTLNQHVTNFILSDRNTVSASFRLSTIGADEETDMVDVLVAARVKAHKYGVGWKKFATPNSDGPLDHDGVRKDARLLVKHLDRSLPQEKIKAVAKLFEKYLDDNSVSSTKLNTRLGRVLHIRAATHFHLVASEVADFFACHDKGAVSTDALYKSCLDRWQTVRVQFVDCLTNVQTTLRRELGHPPTGIAESTARVRTPEETRTERDISGIPSEPATTPVKAYARRDFHLAFEAVINKDSKVAHEDPSLRRMVFVDNLPVDVTEKMLYELYSRCGEISSVRIFQQRPDLDPGPLTTRAVAKKRKQRYSKGKSLPTWNRQRCPVYALVDFADDEGYRRATDATLRLFGMVVEYHDVRSIRASDMNTLFVEELQWKIDGKSFVRSFEDVLMNEWAICLKAGQNQNSVITSAEVKFPSFTDAYRAFQIVDAASIAKVQWMRTPKDANDWWTRARVV